MPSGEAAKAAAVTVEGLARMDPRERRDIVATRVMGWCRHEKPDDALAGWMEENDTHKWWAGWLAIEPRFTQGPGYHEYQTPCEPCGSELFDPWANVRADYEVLSRVREAWGDENRQAGFDWHLTCILGERYGGNHVNWKREGLGLIRQYQPGDYSLAALAVVLGAGREGR